MSIFKAFILTLLITLIEAGIQLISFVGYKQGEFSTGFDHLYGVTIILCRIIAYTSVFYFFWRKDLGKNSIQLPDVNFRILIYLLLMSFGLRLIGEPFWDYTHIFRSAEISFYSFKGINANLIYHSISTLIIAPVLEELFFRKFLITGLLQKYSKMTALVVSALLFAAIHWETLNNLLPAFIFGIMGGIIYIKTKSIVYPILLHFMYNFLGTLMIFNSKMYSELLQWLNFGILYWGLFCFGILLTLFGLRQIASEAKPDRLLH